MHAWELKGLMCACMGSESLKGLMCGPQITAAVARTPLFNEELTRKYRREMSLRKRYYNQLVQLKGRTDLWNKLLRIKLREPCKDS